ncbi:MAG: SIMPL domain-containing protein [Candidatus Gracilibacteria bacterium]|jgi:uncharacterized protein YggE|nr:SIMPL domain-containing protein [Candidatus Gracilibacteria bacterium]
MGKEREIHGLSLNVFILASILTFAVFTFLGFRVYEIWNSSKGDYPREITIDAVGKAFVNPDTAIINLGVFSIGDTTEIVTKENNEKMNKIFETIKSFGVEEKDIKTTSYYLNPNWEWDEKKKESIEKGYRLDQNITIKVRDLNKSGEIIAKATSAGANLVGGISFAIEDEESAKEEARTLAISAAKEKAKLISKETGIKLGKVLSYYEYTDNYFDGYANAVRADMGMGEAVSEMAVPSISAGQQEVVLRVSFTYRIK